MGKPLNILVPDRLQICQRNVNEERTPKQNEVEEEKGQGRFRAWI